MVKEGGRMKIAKQCFLVHCSAIIDRTIINNDILLSFVEIL